MKQLQQPLTLPCGATFKNRIAKAAMAEGLSDKNFNASEKHFNVYNKWLQSGSAMILTGNIMVDRNAISGPGDVVVDNKTDKSKLENWAKFNIVEGTHFWGQLNHPGKQAVKSRGKQNVAPSAIPLNVPGSKLAFGIPRALEEEEIWELIEKFANAAEILKNAGFTGVQLHAAHGYLASQFLSPYSNQRKDKWGGSLENRSRFAVETFNAVRAKVGKDFPISYKINSADFQRGGFTEEESMEVVEILSSLGIDLIEVSGGTFEEAAMMGTKKASTIEREAYFLDYVEKVRKKTDTPLMLTGGFRTVSVMNNAIKNNLLDVIGIGRPFALNPYLANQIFDGTITKIKSPNVKTGIKFLDSKGVVNLYWHGAQIKRMGNNKEPKPNMSAFGIITSRFL